MGKRALRVLFRHAGFGYAVLLAACCGPCSDDAGVHYEVAVAASIAIPAQEVSAASLGLSDELSECSPCWITIWDYSTTVSFPITAGSAVGMARIQSPYMAAAIEPYFDPFYDSSPELGTVRAELREPSGEGSSTGQSPGVGRYVGRFELFVTTADGDVVADFRAQVSSELDPCGEAPSAESLTGAGTGPLGAEPTEVAPQSYQVGELVMNIVSQRYCSMSSC